MNNIYNWEPNATIYNLVQRASIISKIRKFFFDRNILEVETPCMSQHSVTDVNICSFKTKYVSYGTKKYSKTLYLSTSPEYHMKRLLSAGIGAIYQISHAFRNNEIGKHHNPEFTILEWYRPSYDMHQLIQEVNDLLKYILKCNDAEIVSYQQIFINFFKLDPLSAGKKELVKLAKIFGIRNLNIEKERKEIILQLLFMLGIESKIGKNHPIFIYHFPSNQASLAKINNQDKRVAERFEAYFKNLEIANGFFELTDYIEQKKRFKADNELRKKLNLPKQKVDVNLLNALKHGLPSCSGVALGIDRLVMLALNASCINEVLSFSVDRC